MVDIESSYKQNNIGQTIYDFTIRKKPMVIVEFGCLYGYSTTCMALALRDLGRGIIHAYDLWDDYKYKNGDLERVKTNLERYGVDDYVTFHKENYLIWLENPTPFDLLHLDISNDGEIIERTYEALKYNVMGGASILFEGGSKERDEIEWMKKYNKKPINPLKTEIPFIVMNEEFPSISSIQFTN